VETIGQHGVRNKGRRGGIRSMRKGKDPPFRESRRWGGRGKKKDQGTLIVEGVSDPVFKRDLVYWGEGGRKGGRTRCSWKRGLLASAHGGKRRPPTPKKGDCRGRRRSRTWRRKSLHQHSNPSGSRWRANAAAKKGGRKDW